MYNSPGTGTYTKLGSFPAWNTFILFWVFAIIPTLPTNFIISQPICWAIWSYKSIDLTFRSFKSYFHARPLLGITQHSICHCSSKKFQINLRRRRDGHWGFPVISTRVENNVVFFVLIGGLWAETVCGTNYVDISTTSFSITQFYICACSVTWLVNHKKT